ncbi:2TM domain-containing protein [uncultured Polaribacter sp.]|uniref:2TM domain-containing protein n=1 Tax=uncultured Polaribacter sp. TaxID=174711 RepID=UPI00262312F6|nr:2TM domain-containing protein [uncultured Polaribacter sp.]
MEIENHHKLKRAKRRIEEIKKFYKHLVAYTLFNIILTFFWSFSFKLYGDVIFSNKMNDDGFLHYPIWLVWGFLVLIHAIKTFGFPNLFSSKWEEKKIKDYMKK